MYVEEQRKIEKKTNQRLFKFRIYSCTCAYTNNFGTCTCKKNPTKQLAKQTCLFHKAKRPIKRPLSGLQEKNFFENNIFKLVYDIIS